MSALDSSRLRLPVIDVRLLFDDFEQQPVVLTDLPSGPWSSPIADVIFLAKIAKCLRPRKILEVGSYVGHTTKLLAQHTPPEARIVAFDRDPRHGKAYRDSPTAAKIERRVGEVNPEAFAADEPGSYDLIFLDADHTYRAVRHDSEILMPLLASGGIFIWHDYANWGRFSKKNGVPEYLHELAKKTPVVAAEGSWLAAHSPSWTLGAGAEQLRKALRKRDFGLPGEDPWTAKSLRG